MSEGMKTPDLRLVAPNRYAGTYRGVEFEVFEQWHMSPRGWFIQVGQEPPVRSGNTRREAVHNLMLKVNGKI
jgi:hypothetical protein